MAVKSVALVAHDNKKKELVDWVSENRTRFAPLKLYATGTTGRLLRDNLERDDIHCLLSGPLGGDQQIGAKIACNRATAEFILTSAYMTDDQHHPKKPDFSDYTGRPVST